MPVRVPVATMAVVSATVSTVSVIIGERRCGCGEEDGGQKGCGRREQENLTVSSVSLSHRRRHLSTSEKAVAVHCDFLANRSMT